MKIQHQTQKSRARFAKALACVLPLASVFSTSAGVGAVGGTGGIASREVERRQTKIEDARLAMERGDHKYAEGDFEGALSEYRAAKDTFDQMPNAPFIKDWRDLANLKFADCAAVVAQKRAAKGDYPGSQKLIDEAQAAVPGHRASAKFATKLADPDRWPPALTPQHVENVEKVKGLLYKADSARELGRYDDALAYADDALRVDPYNEAARRIQEKTEQEKSRYYTAAYDHTRITALNQVAQAWERKPVVSGVSVASDAGTSLAVNANISQKLQDIIIPSIQFSDATLDEAIEYLRVKSREVDSGEADPAKKGVNIIVRKGAAAAEAGGISLNLSRLPLAEVLRYVCAMSGTKYKVEPNAVLITPQSEVSGEMFQKVFRVPPDFLTSSSGSGDAAAEAAPADPFAAGGGVPASNLPKKKSALEVLKDNGITFPEGASAIFNAGSSQLIVKNTQEALDQIEAYIDALYKGKPKQVTISTKFVEITQKNTDELGFDWLLGAFGGEVQLGGGTAGNSGVTAGYTGDIASMLTSGAVAPVSRGLRSGSRAVSSSSIDSLFSAPPAGSDTVAPGVLSLAGVFTNPQFGLVVRALSQKKGVDLMSAPSVTTKSGNKATVEITREFIYPTEFEAPQLSAGGVGAPPPIVTPANPGGFQMRRTGVVLEVEPTIGENGAIDISLAPEVTEFDGFINYGSPIFTTGGTNGLANLIPSVFPNLAAFIAAGGSVEEILEAARNTGRVELTPNVINQPVFSVRKVTTNVTVYDGATVALGGLIREDVQDVEDKIPVLGDMPFIGRMFRSHVEDHFKRNLTIFATANLIDPSGQPIGATANPAGSPGDVSTVTSNPLIPAIQ
jgi:general secretion pathway protein D